MGCLRGCTQTVKSGRMCSVCGIRPPLMHSDSGNQNSLMRSDCGARTHRIIHSVHSFNRHSCGKCLLLIVSGPTKSLKTSLLVQAGNELVTGFERPIPRCQQPSETMSLFLHPERTVHLNWGGGSLYRKPPSSACPLVFMSERHTGWHL